MREIDRRAEEEFSIPSLILMENAGRGVVEALRGYFGRELGNKKIWLFCGKGNNAGDGFVVARHLFAEGAEVKIFLLTRPEVFTGDARINFEILRKIGVEIKEVTNEDSFASLLEKPDIIVDALFGTGFAGKPEGIYQRAIEFINSSPSFVVSVDIPSGVSSGGRVFDSAIRAHLTVTMGLIKDSLILFPGKRYVGQLFVANIGIPNPILEREGDKFLLAEDDVKKFIPKRLAEGNKGTFGKVLVIAGSLGFSGAASLTALAALRIGCGLVRLASLEEIMPALEAKLTEVVKIPLSSEDGAYSLQSLSQIEGYLADADAIALGPGIGTREKTKEFIGTLLPKVKKPLVIDADGINNLAGNLERLDEVEAPVILTPHPGELGRILNLSPQKINEDRMEIAKDFAIRHQIFLVLKGAPTVIASPEGKVFINSTGNSGLASGGTGDVLTGFIAGLLAQGVSPLESALAGVYIHGRCADIGVREKTEYAFIASDILQFLPLALRELLV